MILHIHYSGSTEVKNFQDYKTPNIETGLVYGTIYLTLLDKEGNVRIGIENNLIDTYDFDYQKDASFYRNMATMMGLIVAGSGKPYDIRGYGLGKLRHRHY